MSGTQSRISSFHDPLAAAMQRFLGQTLATWRIIDEFVAAHPHLAYERDWVQPSDHCKTRLGRQPDDACDCAGTERAIFDEVIRGHYRVRQPGEGG
jgi:hypothetical protein